MNMTVTKYRSSLSRSKMTFQIFFSILTPSKKLFPLKELLPLFWLRPSSEIQTLTWKQNSVEFYQSNGLIARVASRRKLALFVPFDWWNFISKLSWFRRSRFREAVKIVVNDFHGIDHKVQACVLRTITIFCCLHT